MKNSICNVSAAIGSALACTPLASADITSANWVDDTHFNYRVQHMPDLDQKREGLLCDGSMHCVPTCASNLVAYAANHGFASVAPGPNYWEGNSNYNLGTTVIGFMGILMQTDCGGTGGGDATAGLNDWLAGNNSLLVNEHLSVFNGTPTHKSIGKSLCAGRIGSLSYGYYDVTGYLFNTPIVERDGGHCVTAVKVRQNGAVRELWVRNPGSDEDDQGFALDLNSQSVFWNDIFNVQDITVIVVDDDGSTVKTMTAINYTEGDSTIKLIDGHRTLTPAFGYSWDSSLGAIVFVSPSGLVAASNPPTSHPSPTGTAVLNMDWLDSQQELIVVCAGTEVGPSTLHAIDSLTGASHPIATLGAPQLTTVGRDGRVFIYNGAQVTYLNYPEPGNGPILTLPHAAHALIYDDANDDIVLFSRTDRKLIRIDATLIGGMAILNVPTSIPLGTKVQIALNPADGSTWLWTDAANTLFRLVPDGAGGHTATPLNHAALTAVLGFDFNDLGNLVVSNAGTIIELTPATGGGWTLVRNPLFGGQPTHTQLHIARSRTNFRAGIHDTEAWTKGIDPADLEINPNADDCLADIAPALDTDGKVDVNDLLMVINGWGICGSEVSCIADIAPSTGDGQVGVDDLLLVINSWGLCK